MSGWRQWLVPGTIFAVIVAAIAGLFSIRLGGGDVYPPYSSLRADALGTRALFEALGQLPDMRVAREYRPLEQLKPRPYVVLLPGAEWRSWEKVPANKLRALNAAAQSGARIVIGFRAEKKVDVDNALDDDEQASAPTGKKKDAKPAGKDRPEKSDKSATDDAAKKKRKLKHPGIPEWEERELAKEWGVTLSQRTLFFRGPGAERFAGAPAELPASVVWQGDVFFGLAKDSPWRVLYRRANEPVLIEKTVGRGSIVLMTDSFCLSNEAVQRQRETNLLTWIIGDYRQVTFVESELGVLEESGVGALARRYGLGGAFALAILLGVLYAWRRQVEFVPWPEKARQANEVMLTYSPTAGFTALLRRSFKPAGLLSACVEEWRKSRRGAARPADGRLEAAWTGRSAKQAPAETYNAMVRALKSR